MIEFYQVEDKVITTFFVISEVGEEIKFGDCLDHLIKINPFKFFINLGQRMSKISKYLIRTLFWLLWLVFLLQENLHRSIVEQLYKLHILI